jgi:hypothetical protein
VRNELAKQDNLDVKAILISPDGNWRAKPEPKPQKRKAPYDDDDSSDDEQPRKNSIGDANKKKVVEVIELDDD